MAVEMRSAKVPDRSATLIFWERGEFVNKNCGRCFLVKVYAFLAGGGGDRSHRDRAPMFCPLKPAS